jgi:hypothetical protein
MTTRVRMVLLIVAVVMLLPAFAAAQVYVNPYVRRDVPRWKATTAARPTGTRTTTTAIQETRTRTPDVSLPAVPTATSRITRAIGCGSIVRTQAGDRGAWLVEA